MNRYYVGHLVEGAVADFYHALTTELADKFGITNLSERSPAHMTLKPPFSSTSIDLLKADLVSIAKEAHPTQYTTKGFRSFGTSSIYMAIEPNRELQEAAELISTAIDGFGEDRSPSLLPLRLHISVARHLTPETHSKIWKYLQEQSGSVFENSFDNVTLFRQDGGKWQVEEICRFG